MTVLQSRRGAIHNQCANRVDPVASPRGHVVAGESVIAGDRRHGMHETSGACHALVERGRRGCSRRLRYRRNRRQYVRANHA